MTYNQGYAGSCVDYAVDRFHQFTGVYPYAVGDARYMATSAAAHGWTVSATPRINSMAVFQPGDNGAGAGTGHVAWVEQVSGQRIYIGEMNAPTAFVVSHRWVDAPAPGVRYIYAA
jgi:surface antigen